MKFLFFPQSWVLAHTSRCVEIAKALRILGHEAVFAGADIDHPKSNLRLARDEGFRVEHAKEPDIAYMMDRYMAFGAFTATLDLSRPQRWAPIDKILISQVRLIEREAPDMAVGAQTMTVSLAAHIAGVKCAGILNSYLLRSYSTSPIVRHYMIGLERGQFGKLRKRALKELGQPNIDPLPLFQKMPLLCPDAPDLFQDAPFFKHVHCIGPIIFEHPAPLPDWMDELEDGTPNVYIGMGSTGRLDLFLRKCFRPLSKLPYRFLVTTGGLVSEETIQNAPDNFRFTKFAPGSELLKHCRAMIFHGGNGTMYQALASGVPMVAVPSHIEQGVNARMGKKAGFAIRVRPWTGFAYRIAHAVTRAIEDPKYRTVAERIAETIDPQAAPKTAANIMVGYATGVENPGHAA